MAKTLETRVEDRTIHLHKCVNKVQFKKRAARAIREIKACATKVMKTQDVRIDSALNKFVWSKGIRNIPKRVRVRMSRKRNDNEDAKEKMYTLVQVLEVPSFKGLQTCAVREEDAEVEETA